MQNVILLKIHKAIHFHGDYCKFVYTKMSWADCRMAKTKRKFILAFIVAFTGKYQDHIS